MRRPLCSMLVVAMTLNGSFAQSTETTSGEATDSVTTEATTQPSEAPPAAPAFFRLDYSGDIQTRPAMTGDWGGLRNDLAEHGISFKVETLQFGQGNAHGGNDTEHAFNYSGSADYTLEFDTGRMGLWPGGYIKLRGETMFGHSINQKVDSISPVNFDALLPAPDDGGLTTLTEAYIMQFLSEKAWVLGGKVDLSRLPGQNVFASDPYLHFMNTSLWQNPLSFAMVPYTTMTAGAGFAPTKWFDMATMVVDSYGIPTESGFDTAFHSPNGLTLLQCFNFHVKPFDLPGNQRFNIAWSSRDRLDLDDVGRALLAGQVAPSFDRINLPRGIRRVSRTGRLLQPMRLLSRTLLASWLAPEPRPDDWALWYDFDQYFYTEPCDPQQGIGVFGKFGWSPGDSNLLESFYAIGIGGKGVIPDRDADRLGLGYFHLNLNDGLPSFLGIHSEQGVELFYNIELTPWLHITPDVQVIMNPGGGFQNQDVALVYGIRMQATF